MQGLFEAGPLAGSAIAELLRDEPIGFVDVGARGGVHPIVEPLGKAVAILGFEPDPDECDAILATHRDRSPFASIELEPIALAGHEGDAELHLLTVDTNHSLLGPNMGYVNRYDMVKWHEVGRTPLSVTTLDRVIFDRRNGEGRWGEVLKLDTQGTEYDILQGAPRTLDERTMAVVAEVSFCELYEGQKLFSEVEQLLRDAGFAFFGFNTFRLRSRGTLSKLDYRGRERMIQADAVFFRDPLPGAVWRPGNVSPRQSAILFVMAVMLEYYDFAIEIADAFWADHEDYSRLVDTVKQYAALDPASELQEMAAVLKDASARPDVGNLLVGRFVDRRRDDHDYADMAAALEKT